MSDDAAGPAEALTVESAKPAALKQVEFYFADANLPYDKFLFTLSRKDADGWVPIKTIASFKRMKPICDVLGVEGIADALRTSAELLEVDEAGERVRRARELVPVSDVHSRSIYAKGFPDEYDGLQKELEAFFEQFGKINGVRMRRENDKSRKFKNSVFVEFAETPTLNAFLEQAKGDEPVEDGGHGVQYKDTKLQVMSKPAYMAMKIKEKGIDPNADRGARGKGPRKFNAFRELEREKTQGTGAPASTRSDPLEFEYNGTTLATLPDGSVDAENVTFPPDSVLRFTGASSGGSWKDLKDTLTTMHPTSFVEFPADAEEGVVGFRESVSDEKLDEIKKKGITVGGAEVAWERVDEAKAKDFYVDRAKYRASYLLDRREAERNTPSRGRGRGRGGRGGRGHGRGGRGGRSDNARKRTADGAPPEVGSAKRTKPE
ncbi:hypothetical protein MSPP1_002829 [Malassezia sp. CBS 17886]|nr:hypothetical protein MSPP1_002829 [Malassezia sp. CBS 17886]